MGLCTGRNFQPPAIGTWTHVNESRPPDNVTVLGCWGRVADDISWDIEACVYSEEEWSVRGSDSVASPDYWAPLQENDSNA